MLDYGGKCWVKKGLGFVFGSFNFFVNSTCIFFVSSINYKKACHPEGWFI